MTTTTDVLDDSSSLSTALRDETRVVHRTG